MSDGSNVVTHEMAIAGRDCVITFRHMFCGAPSLATVLADFENYTEYADECEALAKVTYQTVAAAKAA